MDLRLRINIELAKPTNYLILGNWSDQMSYKLSDAGVPVVRVPDGTSLGYSVYALNVAESTVGASPSGAGSSEWRLVESAEFIYMQQAYIERLQAAIVTAEKIESMMIRTSNIEILEGAIVKGTLDGVIGSFRRLNCVDGSGNVIGAIRFGTDGRIWFENCSISHQAASGPFLASDVWVRGAFGASIKTTLLIQGTNYGYIYPNGIGDSTGMEYVTFTSGTDSSGNTYYNIPLYSPTSNSSGMPIDLVVIRHGQSGRYNLPFSPSKELTLINSYDQNSNVYIYTNGRVIQMHGGLGITMACVGSNQNPDNSSWLGRGWQITGYNDNQWT